MFKFHFTARYSRASRNVTYETVKSGNCKCTLITHAKRGWSNLKFTVRVFPE